MTDLNPYASPVGQADTPTARTNTSVNWFDRRFLFRCLLVTGASYAFLPILWGLMLAVRDLYLGTDVMILRGSFWQSAFASKIPTLILFGTTVSAIALSWVARSHRNRLFGP